MYNVTNGDVIRNMDNQSLAELLCSLIDKVSRHKFIHIEVDKHTKEWYNENIIKTIKDWFDEPYYGLVEGEEELNACR